MSRWKKIVAVAVAAVVVSGAGAAGAAWALADDAPPARRLIAPAGDASSRALTGGAINETTFTEITPCRLVDTRLAGGKIAAGTSRIYTVGGAGPAFASQGGKTNGCGIPAGATAIEATVTAVDSGSGFLRVWPANVAAPNATFMNFTPTFNASNTGTVAINKCAGICVLGRDLAVRSFGSATHLVIDVNGYYERQMVAYLNEYGTLISSNRTVSAAKLGTGEYEVIFDRKVSDCVLMGGVAYGYSGSGSAAPRLGKPNGVVILTYNPAGALTNLPAYVEVAC